MSKSKLVSFSDMMAKESPATRKRVKAGADQLLWRLGFARRFRLALHFSTFTQAALAREVGVTWQTISAYCRGIKVPTVYTLSKIVIAFKGNTVLGKNRAGATPPTADKLLGTL